MGGVSLVKRWIIGLTTVALFWVGKAKATELVVNGGFETGTYAGWTLSGDTQFDFITSDPAHVHSGNFAAQFAGFRTDTFLSQDIATTPGDVYLLSYWLQADGLKANDITVSFAGQVLFSQTNVDAFPYTQYTFNVTATRMTSTLQFAARDDPGWFYLDDVSVQSLGAAAPEPATLTLLGVSVAGLAAFTWRRQRNRTIESHRQLRHAG